MSNVRRMLCITMFPFSFLDIVFLQKMQKISKRMSEAQRETILVVTV